MDIHVRSDGTVKAARVGRLKARQLQCIYPSTKRPHIVGWGASRWTPTASPYPGTTVPAATAKADEASTSAYDVELQRLLLAGPQTSFDFRAEVTPGTRRWVIDHAPQLLDLVDDGTLVMVPRRPDYRERRTDGYLEPQVVVLVGTAHVSRRSQLDVTRIVRALTPDSVVVELCKSRSAALAAAPPSLVDQPDRHTVTPPTSTAAPASAPIAPSGSESDSEGAPTAASHDAGAGAGGAAASRGAAALGSTGGGPQAPAYVNPMNLAGGSAAGGGAGGGGRGDPGGGFLGAVARSVSLGGQSALLLRVLLAGLASRTAGSLGVAGGGEFAAAQAAADEVGAQVVLGDRPVEITLSRAWAALPLGRRLALCRELLAGALGTPKEALSEDLVERLKSDDAVGAFFNQLSASYPELVAPLITERDLYLAWSLKRSMAVNGARLVVGVVGRGHMRGVVHALLRDQGGAGLRFTDLVDGKNNKSRRRAKAAQGAARLGVELALGTLAYFAWLAWTQQS